MEQKKSLSSCANGKSLPPIPANLDLNRSAKIYVEGYLQCNRNHTGDSSNHKHAHGADTSGSRILVRNRNTSVLEVFQLGLIGGLRRGTGVSGSGLNRRSGGDGSGGLDGGGSGDSFAIRVNLELRGVV